MAMPLTIKMADGTTKEVTLRPTIDVESIFCPETDKMRAKAIRKKIRISHELTRRMWFYRDIQRHMMEITEKCTMKEACALSEDPDPYDKSYVFYCLD